MRKEFTVGDLVKVLQKFDPDLLLYDSYEDENEGKCWFNLQSPKPRTKTLYLLQYQSNDGTTLLKLTDSKEKGMKVLSKQKVLILYPLNKGEIEIG